MSKLVKMERVDDETQLPSPVAEFWKLLNRRIDEAKARSIDTKEFDALKIRVAQTQEGLKSLACGTCRHAAFQITRFAPSFVSETREEGDSGTEFDLLRVHCGALGGVSCELSAREWDENAPATAFQEVLVACEAKEEASIAPTESAPRDLGAEAGDALRVAMEVVSCLESGPAP